MQELKAARLLQANNWISSLQQMLNSQPPNSWFGLVPADYEQLKTEIEFLCVDLPELGMDLAAQSAEELKDIMNNRVERTPDGNFRFDVRDSAQFKAYCSELAGRMVAHLRTSLVLFVPLADARLYEPKEPVFGPNFENKFRSASYDLEEAAKCLALGRDTACAFHLVRIVEVALRAVHACLGINVALVGNDRNRGTILGRIRDDLKNRGNKWPEKATFDEIYALLDSVKGRWRDATMHVEEKYTPQEAQRLFQTIHNFMERLSARMDENGEPKV